VANAPRSARFRSSDSIRPAVIDHGVRGPARRPRIHDRALPPAHRGGAGGIPGRPPAHLPRRGAGSHSASSSACRCPTSRTRATTAPRTSSAPPGHTSPASSTGRSCAASARST